MFSDSISRRITPIVALLLLLGWLMGCNIFTEGKPARIVYGHDTRESTKIFLLEEGEDEGTLVADGGISPVPSPNGESILFSSHLRFDLRRFDIETGETHILADASAGHIFSYQWSPDNQQIVFTRNSPYMADADIYVINSDGTNERQLTDLDGVGNLAWSPDGSTIAYLDGDIDTNILGLWLLPVNGGTSYKLVNIPTSYYPMRIRWSPDGSSILYACGVESISRFCSINVTQPTATPIEITEGRDAKWSPDGTKIVFTRALKESDSRIFIWTLESGDIRDVTKGSYPAWSPDGSEIAFVNEGIYILDLAEGAEPRLITKDEGQPHWVGTP